MQTNALDKRLLQVKEAASELGVHEATVRRAIAAGELEAVRLGPRGRYRVTTDALERFLQPVKTGL
jgi:excisionase family DNA binding protein